MIDIDRSLTSQRRRRIPRYSPAVENFSTLGGIGPIYESTTVDLPSKGLTYIARAMAEIPHEETQGILAEGKKFARDLITNADLPAVYAFQGSVPLNIHIETASDLDILFIDTRDTFVQKYCTQHINFEKQISTKDRIKDLREKILSYIRFANDIDAEHNSKSIKIKSPHLLKEIDIVPARWWDTDEYKLSYCEHERGIVILDVNNNKIIKNLPFKHIFLVDKKDTLCKGGIRKLIRLLKNIKVDSTNYDKIKLSSFDITSLVFSMKEENLINKRDCELLAELYFYMVFLREQPNFAQNIETPDKTRKVFDTQSKFQSLKFLIEDLIGLSNQLVALENIDKYQMYKRLTAMDRL